MAKKVLFINNINQNSIIADIVISAGHDVHKAYDIKSGLQLLECLKYDCIILVDNSSEGTWMLCRNIRNLTTSPLLVINHGASAEACVKAINSGADFFLRKDFGSMELLARINILMQRPPIRQPAPLFSSIRN
jgi:DNA-binding response OmpR family regulator